MAVCTHCGEEMQQALSCRPDGYVVAGTAYAPVRWGAETPRGRWKVSGPRSDCGTPPGGVHHPGCCVEQCPACGWPVISCNCHEKPADDEHPLPRRCSSHRPPV